MIITLRFMTNDPGQPGWAPPPRPDEPEYGQPGYGGQYGEAPQYPQQQYGQPAPHDPYGQPAPQGQPAPYGQHDPYGQPLQDPYGQYHQPPYPQPLDAPTQQFTPVGHPVNDPYTQYLPPVPPDQQHASSPPKKKGKGGLIALAGALVLAVCGAGGVAGGYYFTRGSSGDKAADTSPVTAAADPSTTPGPTGAAPDKLRSRTTDPAPVTVDELGAATYTASTGTFTKTGDDRDANCASAVDNAARALVASLGCSQAVTVTAVNQDKGCVVTFGILNLPDAASAEKVITGMTDGAAGSFLPRRHDAPAEGKAGDPQTGSWWFLMKSNGHYVTFASGAYADGKRVQNRDATMVACDTDMLDEVNKRISARA